MGKVDNYRDTIQLPLAVGKMSEQLQFLPWQLRDIIAVTWRELMDAIPPKLAQESVTAIEILILCAVKVAKKTKIVSSISINSTAMKTNVLEAQIDCDAKKSDILSHGNNSELRIHVGFSSDMGRFQKVVPVTPELVKVMTDYCAQEMSESADPKIAINDVKGILSPFVAHLDPRTWVEAIKKRIPKD